MNVLRLLDLTNYKALISSSFPVSVIEPMYILLPVSSCQNTDWQPFWSACPSGQ
jgi:hypothetical protein